MPRNNRLQPEPTGFEEPLERPFKPHQQATYRLPERKAPTGIEPVEDLLGSLEPKIYLYAAHFMALAQRGELR
jgi:hypothetical protein